MIDPYINSFIQEYLESYEIEARDEFTNFELFANYCVFYSSNDTRDKFDVDKVHTGQPNDTGLDGIGILIDGVLVNSEDDAENVIGNNKTRNIELKFIFIQAKSENSFKSDDLQKTVSSVEDFFSDYLSQEPIYSRSQKIQEKASLASYLLKTYSRNMRKRPECDIYHITLANSSPQAKFEKTAQQLILRLKQKLTFFAGINFQSWNYNDIVKLYSQTKLQIEAVINVENSFSIKVPRVKRAYITAMSFKEFSKIILDKEGNRGIIDFIFYDNVRGFQGENEVNEDIKKTIESEQNSLLFPLLNNGVTIIAQEIELINEKEYRLVDYQIVNGCQTSHVLSFCKDNPNINNVVIPVKIIETDDDDIRNSIIKATNSQTEVKKELLAALSDFNKTLEQCYEVQNSINKTTIYYERRPGQFIRKNIIKNRVIKIRSQIKSFTAMFLDEPHLVGYFGQNLADRISKDIFSNSHYPIAYYVSSLAYYQLEYLCNRKSILTKEKMEGLSKIKYHLIMIFKYLAIEGECASFTNKKYIEKYCTLLTEVLDDIDKCSEVFYEAKKLLHQLAIDYCKNNNRFTNQNESIYNKIPYQDICKEIAFTNFILSQINAKNRNLKNTRQKEIDSKQFLLPLKCDRP